MVPDSDGGSSGVIFFAATAEQPIEPSPYSDFIPRWNDSKITLLHLYIYTYSNLLFPQLKGNYCPFIDAYMALHFIIATGNPLLICYRHTFVSDQKVLCKFP